MPPAAVSIVRTGAANLASVVAAFRRLGCSTEIVDEPEVVDREARVVLPGVGAFGPVAVGLEASGLAAALRRRVEAGRPTLAICLGLHLLAKGSDEAPGQPGLGVIPGTVGRFQSGVKVPQLGWNRVLADPSCRLLATGAAYFANSFRLEAVPDGWSAAVSEHGGAFVAGLERGAVLGCQFHPELSGEWGEGLLRRWLEVEPC
jgi:glutamine amidotransferase